jgi:alkylated DNA nucleotide flippase Atl1
MQVRETTLKELIQGEKQFRVPLWQRQYTWKRDEHLLLWSDILEQYAQLLPGSASVAGSGHFLGSFVLSPAAFAASDVASFLIVDGQQRMTTLLLILCALRDAQASEQAHTVDRINELYLVNKWKAGLARLRLLPTQDDRAAFEKCVIGAPGAGGQDGIGACYRFFRSQLELSDPEGEPLDLALLERVVVERLVIVDITTGAGDNAHRIFQSLNGTGVGLTQADLLRNYIFMLLPSRGETVYAQMWRPMEQLVGFDNLEGLARVDLQRRGIDVAKDDVYRLHQERLDVLGGQEEAVEDVVRDLVRRAEHYKRLIDPDHEPDPQLRDGLRRLGRWGAQTTYPLLMYAYELLEREACGIEEVRQVVSYVEGFLIRRHLAGVATNALNRLFVAIIEQLPPEVGFADAVRQVLSGERRHWPTDAQIVAAVKTRPFYFNGRTHQRKLILERLEQSYEHPEPVDLANAELTIEHILPQTLSPEWRQHLQDLGQDPDEVRDELVHTLGNLTLTGVNAQLSNNPFERKQELYAHSHLELNRDLPEQPAWGREQIIARAERLAERVIAIWPGPLPGFGDVPIGFDWSRINAAIAAIPAGRWTTYGDLAQLGGTAPVPVGQHVANTLGLPNAYRVLGANGAPRPNFHWNDPDDDRDIVDVLMAEGIILGDSGAADQHQRIGAEELVALIETPDEDNDADLEPLAMDAGSPA